MNLNEIVTGHFYKVKGGFLKVLSVGSGENPEIQGKFLNGKDYYVSNTLSFTHPLYPSDIERTILPEEIPGIIKTFSCVIEKFFDFESKKLESAPINQNFDSPC